MVIGFFRPLPSPTLKKGCSLCLPYILTLEERYQEWLPCPSQVFLLLNAFVDGQQDTHDHLLIGSIN